MKIRLSPAVCTALLAGPLALLVSRGQGTESDAEPVSRPVDDSMHHFMEYVFEPNYKRLRVTMALPEKGKAEWKSVKGDALTLAEACNLLLDRAPEEDRAEWRRLSALSRESGAALYQAARAQDAEAAGRAYRTMLKHCNACHDRFADGEHQLEP